MLRGVGHKPHIVEGEDPDKMHQAFAAALDRCLDDIADIQQRARSGELDGRPRWPMLVLRSPKGWTIHGDLRRHRAARFQLRNMQYAMLQYFRRLAHQYGVPFPSKPVQL